MLSQGPITMDGDLAGSIEPAAGEGRSTLSLGGQSMQFGFKMVDDKAYLNYMGTWYEAPPDAMKELSVQQAAEHERRSSGDAQGAWASTRLPGRRA